jgi:hypothetical protein
MEITYKFFAPLLSAQFITAVTGRAFEILNLTPTDPGLPEESVRKMKPTRNSAQNEAEEKQHVTRANTLMRGTNLVCSSLNQAS